MRKRKAKPVICPGVCTDLDRLLLLRERLAKVQAVHDELALRILNKLEQNGEVLDPYTGKVYGVHHEVTDQYRFSVVCPVAPRRIYSRSLHGRVKHLW